MKRNVILLPVLCGFFLCSFFGCGGKPVPAPSAQGDATSTSPAAVTAPSEPQVAYAQLMETADQLIHQRDLNHAVRVLTQAIQQEPGRTEAYLKRAAVFADAKILTRAVADMSAAIKIDSESPKLRNTRGYFLLLLQQYEQADRDFSDAIGLDLNYPQPYNNRGLVAIGQREHERALKDFDNALRIKPDYVDAINNRGFALLQLNRLPEAVDAFSLALDLDPAYVNALSNRGRAYFQQQNLDAAIADFSRLIELQPENLQHYSHRSEAYLALGREREAAADVRHVSWTRTLTALDQKIQRNPRDAELWVARGQHLAERQQPELALESYQRALQLKPRLPSALLGRAQAALHLGQHERVVADCTLLLEDSPRVELYSLRGDAYLEMGRIDDAISDFEESRRFDSRVSHAYRARAAQRREAGQAELAQADEEFANSLELRLTETAVETPASGPREMVIEPVSYEATASTSETVTR